MSIYLRSTIQADEDRLFQHGNWQIGVVGQIQRNYRQVQLKQSPLSTTAQRMPPYGTCVQEIFDFPFAR